MSSRRWSSSEDRLRLETTTTVFISILSRVYVDMLIKICRDINFANDDDDNDGDGIRSNIYTSIVISNILSPIWTMLQQQYHRVMMPLEDDIEFGMMKTIEDFSESVCFAYFRFCKEDLILFAQQLWPRISRYLQSNDAARIMVGNGYVAHYETCLCLYLYKMARPFRVRDDVEHFFGIRKSKASRMIRFFGEALCRLSIRYLWSPTIWHHHMPRYAAAIERKCGLFDNIWGFIDGTIRRTTRPNAFQELLYTRYKRCHGIKFQSIVTPDGFIACLHGPFIARRHDARMLLESQLIETLERLMPADRSNGPIYALYGDLAYPRSIYLFSGFINPRPNSPEALFNRQMSKSRISVEWAYANVTRRYQHLDFQRSMKINQQPIAQQYINCVFLTNIGNCFYGGAINQYFGCEILSLQQYLALIDEV
jgi:DDE superfamily endonuclease